ncbi:ATP-dependent DNA helicase DinG [Salibacterium salarium]|uniref:ATP-dependent DNA helicase DinG n=1 Tax=Salibacterium salarium TaxID=284579 RepID=UPI002781D37B|nr:ATP-dependent DNA helicase DinG [Salibacterium salarium]MDQ0299407.1 ATP-dependent DNA helicase DinG [Salibacterium salarium]
MSNKFVVIDTETTGNAPKNGDKIIQIGISVVEGDRITETFSSFVHPFTHIPVFIQQLTGIKDDDVADAPSFVDIAPKILDLLNDAYFVAHNVPFDLKFINQELEYAGFYPFNGKIIDTVECARILYPSAPGYQLSQLAEWLEISHDRPHQADSDAIVTASVLIQLLNKLKSLPKKTLAWLDSLALGLESDIGRLIKARKNEKVRFSIEDNDQIEEFKGIALKKQVTTKTSNKEEQVEGESSFFSTDGLLASKWDQYEYRKAQEQMSTKIKEALESREHALIEAGTGIGKTIAYLIPALYYSKKTGQRVVVSTHTITLQEQLMHKEIPLLRETVPFSFDSVLLKGKSHYLCLRKFKQFLSTAPSTYEEVLGLSQILVWILETETGDVEEINIAGGSGSTFWEKVCTDDSIFSKASQPWFSRNFYERAKARADKADLLITNHALLFADIKKKENLLPSYKHIVIDEAHHLDELASKNLGTDLNYFYLNQVLQRIGSQDQPGLFQQLLEHEQVTQHYFSSSWYQRREDYYTLLKYEMDELFRMLHQFCRDQTIQKHTDVGRLSIRYNPGNEKSSEWQTIKDTVQRILILFEEEEKAWLSFYHFLSSRVPSGSNEEGKLYDFKTAVEQVEEICESLVSLLLEEDNNYVYWMEVDNKGAANATYLYSRPVEVSDLLADRLFAKKDSVILTSAALTIKDSFSYVIKKWGLEDFGPSELQLTSNYSYDKRAKLLVPEDMALIKNGEKEFIKATAEFIYHAASITEGKMLVLFTSFDMLRKTYYQLKKWDDESDFALIAQGVKSGSRSKLMKTFRQHKQAILLGTNAFWEGIDIPGEDLSCLVIVRLPFPPPDEPQTQARIEQMKREGKNAFANVTLPQAVLRFKQGFGRLIRHKNDKGVVVVLDRRILESNYGTDFIKSLPALPIMQKPSDDLLSEIATFFYEE